MNKNKYCLHCYPSPAHHAEAKISSMMEYHLDATLGLMFSSLIPRKPYLMLTNCIKRSVLATAELLQQASFTKEIKRSQLNNGILVMWDEALRRDLDIYNIQFGEQHSQHFMLKFRGRTYYFDRNPIYLLMEKFNHYHDARKYDDKAYFKKILSRQHLPVPQGRAFISSKKALHYGLTLGFPLVVKPVLSSFSRHTSFNIHCKQELQTAIEIAKQINYRIIVERYIPGDVHRVTVLNHQVLACTKRQAASIIGDGSMSIEELIDEKNNHPWRGKPTALNYTLHTVEKNAALHEILSKQAVNLKTILETGRKIFIAHKMSNGNGADVSNATPFIHPDNEKLFIKIHQMLNVPLSALDFICKDVSVSWQAQEFAFIENNSLPYIDAHHYPSIGEPINVAKLIWDFVLREL